MQAAVGNAHGQGSCFLPLLQNDEDYIAPRIVQVSVKMTMCHACDPPAPLDETNNGRFYEPETSRDDISCAAYHKSET